MNNLSVGEWGTPVSLKDIEAMLAQAAESETGSSVMRTATLNLLIIDENPENLSQMLEKIRGIDIHHPGRIILVEIDPDSDSERIEARVALFCESGSTKERRACSEQIILSAGKKGVKHLTGVLLPLLIPGLPTFLWWPGCGLQRLVEFSDLLELVDRVLLDSPAVFASSNEFFNYLQMIQKLRRRVKLSDMLWGRLTLWREAIARFYDADPQQVFAIRQVFFSFPSGVSFPAFLLLGWFGSVLNWHLRRRQANEFDFVDQKGNKVKVRMISDVKTKDKRGMTIEIQGESEKKCLRRVEYTKEGIETAILRGDRKIGGDLIGHSLQDEGRLLCNELDFLPEDRVYLESIEFLENLSQPGKDR
ncbi:glucose-6-phosphate dehydrogenase assembly protein OpcA [candidate division KSB1 bacterium]|nr:glucose-6-phosphate dehydrogenase assembly protein OpcA [candidate division KSB1 bacterium]